MGAQVSHQEGSRADNQKSPCKSVQLGGIIYLTFTDGEPLFLSKGLMEADRDLQSHLDRTGTFWATILRKAELVEFEKKENLSVCALDPGVRTSNAVHDNQSIVTEMVPGDVRKIYSLCGHADKIQSKMD